MELNGNGVADAKARPTALVLSDVLIYREGIAAGLAQIGDLDVVGAVSAEQLGDALIGNPVEIIFVDISRPRSRDAVRAALDLSGQLHVIGFGMTSEDEGLAGAEVGVTAFIDHNGTIADLNQAAMRALSGIPVCPPQLTTRLLQRVAQLAGRPRLNPDSHLTQRECQIASLVAEGLSNKEIAGALKISPATVKNHVHMILDKLNLPRRRMIMMGTQSAPKEPTAVSAG